MTRLGRLLRPRAIMSTAALSAGSTLLLTALLATPAAAASASITVAPSKAEAGTTVVISGTVPTSGSGSCKQSEAAVLTSTTTLFPPDGQGPRVARTTSGSFQINFTVPATMPAGSYRIGVRCAGGNVGVSADLTVLPQVQQTPTGAPTAGFGGAAGGDGSDTRQWLLAAAILAVAGAGFAVATVRRRSPRRQRASA